MPTILIAEDNRTIRMVAAEALRHRGFTVIEAENGERACSLIEQHAVDLVLTDNEMPIWTGFDLLRYVKNHDQFKTIPVIMMSGQHDKQDEALAKGAALFVPKPFNIRDLINAIEQLLL